MRRMVIAVVLVAFISESFNKYIDINMLKNMLLIETQLPPRVNLFAARYDMFSAPRRTWYEFTPEMDLEKRFKVDACPQLVFVPRRCNGHTKWCERGPDPEDPALKVLGCEDFEEQCTGTKKWGGSGSYVDWVKDLVAKEGRPKLIPFLENYKSQGIWIQKREYTTCNTHFRNSYLAQAFPAFTHRGFKAMETPKEFQQWLLDFHKRNVAHRRTESWHGESTQLSFHEVRTSFVDLDRERYEKERMARKYLQPIVEEWSGMGDLELTSFYGIREYHDGSWLRQHVDRIDTHVLSVTLTVDKRNAKPDAKPWPLQVTDWTGKQVSYEHPPGTMILYESSKLPHGRPEPNYSGDHLGAFLHFKPKHMNSRDASKWDDIATRARRNMHLHMESAAFRQTQVEEPAKYEYTSEGYAEETIWQKPGSDASEPGLTVEFKNEADRSLQVYWYHSSQPDPVLQGKAWPGAKFEIQTFEGHTFFWAEIDSKEPLPGGKFTIDPGKKVYTYNLGKDGKKAPASKWANVVKDKIKEES